MDSFFGLAILILLIVLVVKALGWWWKSTSNQNAQQTLHTSPLSQYNYSAKDTLMTRRETNFYEFLLNNFHNEYHIFPQVHLSSLVVSKDTGKQGWKAFLHINGKSVDYVLCDRTNLKPVCAIELDDWSHASKKRMERDREVERILSEAGMPLVRIKDPDIVDLEKFNDYLSEAKEKRGLM